jgi:membrane-bound lytic murein transglycosylase F
MGYQLELAESFGKFLGYPVKMIAAENIHKLKYYMDYQMADILALNLPVTSSGKKQLKFSDPLGETRLVLVQRKPGKRAGDTLKPIDNLVHFPTDTVFVQDHPFLEPLYHTFYKNSRKKAILKRVTDRSQESLVRDVADGRIRFALCQENLAMVLHRNYPYLDISVLAFPLYSYGWGINLHSDSLRKKVNEWLQKERKKGDLKYTYLSYYQNNRINGYFRSDYFSVSGTKLSPFDAAIRQSSQIIWWDWRLVASLVYQESNFQAGLTSARSAHGLMQLMPETAAKFGVSAASSPARQIEAGVKYLKYLDQQLPKEITDPIERTYFILATYNVGIGRVLTAREKAEKFGRDKNRWNRHVDYYLLRRSKKDPVGEVDSTDLYPIDLKSEGFVNEVVGRYFHYRNLVK